MAEVSTPAAGRDVPAHGVSIAEAFWVWLRVAMLSFGGPAGQIAVMHRIIVEEKRWINESRFLHALNYCMLLPGPEAQQLATYIGWLLHKSCGGILAGGLFVLPGLAAIMVLSWIYALYGSVGIVAALFFGLKAAVLAIVLHAVMRVGKRALKNNVLRAIAGLSFAAMFFARIPFPIIILAAGLTGYIGVRLGWPQFSGGGGHGGAAKPDGPSLLSDQPPVQTRGETAAALKAAAIFLALWLLPVLALKLLLGPDNVFSKIALFFSQMAVVTFGGAYAVLGYVAQEAVQNYQWLAPGEMLDGLSMAETTPGPLDHGAPIRRLHGRLPRAGVFAAPAGGHAGRASGDVGDLHALLFMDIPRRAVHRAAARQPGACGCALGDYGSGGRRYPQSGALVWASHLVCEGGAGAWLRAEFRGAGSGQRRSCRAGPLGSGGGGDLPFWRRSARHAGGQRGGRAGAVLCRGNPLWLVASLADLQGKSPEPGAQQR